MIRTFSLVLIANAFGQSIAALSCPPSGSAYLASDTPNVVTLENKSNGLCTLTTYSELGDLVAIARSYDNKDWEPAPGPYSSSVTFACSGGKCDLDLSDPISHGQPLKLTAFDPYLDVSDDGDRKKMVAKFLEQASFGPTLNEINDWDYDSFDASFKQWVSHQINTEPLSSHREFYRERTNPRMDQVFFSARGGPNPCDEKSRWRKFSFTSKDMLSEKVFSVTPVADGGGTNGPYVAMIDGFARTVISSLELDSGALLALDTDYNLCHPRYDFWKEGKGDSFKIRVGGKCLSLKDGNPPIDIGLLEANNFDLNIIKMDGADLMPIDNPEYESLYWPSFGTGNEFMLKSAFSSPDCEALPKPYSKDGSSAAPIFMKRSVGDKFEYMIYDPHLVLLENTVESPMKGGGGQAVLDTDGEMICSNAPRNFLNEDNCYLSYDESACSSQSPAVNTITLNSEFLKKIDGMTNSYIYAFTGMPIGDEHYLDGRGNKRYYLQKPCQASSDRWTRFKSVDPSMCEGDSYRTVSPETEKLFAKLLSPEWEDPHNPNPTYKDVLKRRRHDCAYADKSTWNLGLIKQNQTCWQHVHPKEGNIYDMTKWFTQKDSMSVEFSDYGGWTDISNWALEADAVLAVPNDKANTFFYSVIDWNKRKHFPQIGKLDDAIRFRDLPNRLELPEVEAAFGEYAVNDGKKGVLVCGSVGEVANKPELGNDSFEYSAWHNFDESKDSSHIMGRQKHTVWSLLALNAKDQLRQRVAFALSQIFSISPNDLGDHFNTEASLQYYDIFVRNAFGSYRDILKQVAFSEKMSRMLSSVRNKSFQYNADRKRPAFPDENFAREVMQLFSIGLHKLNMDGSQVLDADGSVIENYGSDVLMSYSRVWTGLNWPERRANNDAVASRVDPMTLVSEWHDLFPKSDLMGGYIGDRNYPLCIDLPNQHFLKEGATFRLLGSRNRPELLDDPWNWETEPLIKRLTLTKDSPLYKKLCASETEGGPCVFPAKVVLDADLDYTNVPATPAPTSSPTNAPTETSTLVVTGNNGVPDTAFPLGKCEGDCDRDSDCSGNLKCFQRNGLESVPGCEGDGKSGTDYCFEVPPQYLFTMGNNGSPSDAFPLAVCQGDCDNDSECQDGLICMQRNGNEEVPGCAGTGKRGEDYCVPAKSPPPGPRHRELTVESLRTVKIQVGDTPIYYEYVRQPCVEQTFYHDAKKVEDYTRGKWSTSQMTAQSSMCADPRRDVASESCCNVGWQDLESERDRFDYRKHGYKFCEYNGERLSWADGNQRCTDYGKEACTSVSFHIDSGLPGEYCSLDVHKAFYSWTQNDCTLEVKLSGQSEIAVVHRVTPDYSGANRTWSGVDEDTMNFFKPAWTNEIPPGTECSTIEGCYEDGDDCFCAVELLEEAAFASESEAGSLENILQKCFIGAPNPGSLDGAYTSITSSIDGVTVYSKDGSWNSDTIFKYVDEFGKVRFLKNLVSDVSIGEYKFRNPVQFMSFADPELRDAHHEIEAAIDSYFYNPNHAPFLAHNMIQRFGISNPSPRFVEEVATAYKNGSYMGIGSGDYGDLGALIAAILLGDESRSVALAVDQTYGQVREPLVKLISLMRSMEYVHDSPVAMPFLDRLVSDIGQGSHEQQSVFSFFLPEFQPDGAVGNAGLVAPEAQILTGMKVTELLEGLMKVVKNGLDPCDGGFQWYSPIRNGCSRTDGEVDKNYGYLHYSNASDNIDEAIDELSMLLTAGRLSETNKELVKIASQDHFTYGDKDKAMRAMIELILASAEFQTNSVPRNSHVKREPEPDELPTTNDYKAVVFLMFTGGMDSWNMLIPTCPDLYDQYEEVRGEQHRLLPKQTKPITTTGQPCDNFGVNNALSFAQQLYLEGEALFFASTGVLLHPVDAHNYTMTNSRLFAHNFQQREVQKTDINNEFRNTGVGGRILDYLKKNGYHTSANSVDSGAQLVRGSPKDNNPVRLVNSGSTRTFNRYSTLDTITDRIKQLNGASDPTETGLFAETWSSRLIQSFEENDEALRLSQNKDFDVKRFTKFRSWETTFERQLRAIAESMKAREYRNVDKDIYTVKIGGWDMHQGNFLEGKLKYVNEGLIQFKDELVRQGLWDKTVIATGSDFGRTLVPNSNGGTDHAWAGHYFMMGGSVNGGKILGKYPEDIREGAKYRIGNRGRVVPTTPLESMWNGIAQWMGVPEEDLDTILPNRQNFNKCDIYTDKDLFVDGTTEPYCSNTIQI